MKNRRNVLLQCISVSLSLSLATGLAASLVSSASANSGVDALPVRSDMFAQHAPISLSGAGPFHQLAIPLAVYQSVQRRDLGDLRVFNGSGEALPHALLRSMTTATSQIKETAVPLFPIVAARDERQTPPDVSVEVRRRGDDTLVAVRQHAAIAKEVSLTRGVVLDASKLAEQDGMHSLRLEVGATTVPFHAFSIESSNDLQQWRMLKRAAQLVRMEHGGQRIEKNTVEWKGAVGKYLRILWAVPEQAPAILSAAIGTEQTAIDRAPMIWSEPILARNVKGNVYDYTLPGHMPLEQLRIGLAQANTLAPLRIQHYVTRNVHRHNLRRRETSAWEDFLQTVVFRLQSPQGEVLSPDIVLSAASEDRLRLLVDARSGGIGKTGPSLQVGFVPHILVFLPRGEGPFSLAWGAASVGNAALSLSTLIPGYSNNQRLAASPAVLQMLVDVPAAAPTDKAASATAAKNAGSPTSKWLLWAVLIAGVLVLAGMVWGLLKQMKQDA